MKRLAMLPFFVVAFMTLCLVFAQRGYAEQPPVLEVIHSAICLEVVEHACVGTNDVFPANVGKLYCLTRVYGDPSPRDRQLACGHPGLGKQSAESG